MPEALRERATIRYMSIGIRWERGSLRASTKHPNVAPSRVRSPHRKQVSAQFVPYVVSLCNVAVTYEAWLLVGAVPELLREHVERRDRPVRHGLSISGLPVSARGVRDLSAACWIPVPCPGAKKALGAPS